MDKQRVEELIDFINNYEDEAIKEYMNAVNHYMPQIVVDKLATRVNTWQDIMYILQTILQYNGYWVDEESNISSDDLPIDISEDNDMVNSPKHYTSGQYEVIDVIKDWLTEEEFRGYIKGNTLKYVSRERYKNGDEDLLKTIFYLNYLMHGKKSDGSDQ